MANKQQIPTIAVLMAALRQALRQSVSDGGVGIASPLSGHEQFLFIDLSNFHVGRTGSLPAPRSFRPSPDSGKTQNPLLNLLRRRYELGAMRGTIVAAVWGLSNVAMMGMIYRWQNTHVVCCPRKIQIDQLSALLRFPEIRSNAAWVPFPGMRVVLSLMMVQRSEYPVL